MTSSWRERLLWLRRHAVHGCVAFLALLALGNGVGAVMLNVLERHPQTIAQWLSARAGRTVAFDHVATRWTRRGPLLSLDGLRVGDPTDPVRIGRAEIQIAQYSGLLPGHSFTEIRLRGLDLTLQRASNGQWQVRGLPGQQDGEDPLSALEHLGELQLAQAHLRIRAPELGVDLRIPRVDVRMQVNGLHLRVGAQAWLHGAADPIDGVLAFDRGSGDGQVYAGTRRTDLRTLAGAFAMAGVAPEAGNGSLRAWGRLRAHRIVGIHVDTALRDVALRSVVPGTPSQQLAALELQAVWSGTIDDWRLQVPRLRIDDGKPWDLDGISIAAGRHYALHARRLQAAPLLRLAALSNALAPGLRHWLQTSKPDALLEDVDVRGVRGGGLQASARINGFRFDPVGHEPGMRGVTGWLQGDQDGLRMRFDRSALVAFDWPAGFGVVHEFHMDGEAVLWRDDDGWTVHTPGLQIDGGPLQARARGGITFHDDHHSPHLDISADIGDTPIALAHGFWIHHLMPQATVAWLDAALRGGTLRQVHAVVAGDLADWPFRNEPGMAGAGVFRAEAHIDNGTVKFQPDWPAAEHMDANLSFIADGFTVDGRAQLAGVAASELKAGIQRFSASELKVDAKTAGDASRYLALLSASPLHARYGEVMDNLRAGGAASATFSMSLPLGHDQPHAAKVDGEVVLAGVRLREQRWNLDFQQVQGQANYDQDGFVANALQVHSEGEPGALSLRAGPHVQDKANAFEAQLQASLDISGMLGRVDSLKWLLPHARGRSVWTAAVAIPHAASSTTGASVVATPSVLQLHSDLVGTQLDLPLPLRKPAAQALATDIEIRLPMEQGDFTAKLGNLLALHARTRGDKSGLRIVLGGEVAGEPPVNGLLIGGNTPQLDALGWIGALAGIKQASSLPMLGVNVSTRHLSLLGADFPDATVWVAPSGRDTQVTVKAAALNGGLLIPGRDDAAVSGRFDRLYWPSPTIESFVTQPSNAAAKPAAQLPASPSTTPAGPSADQLSPANIPALSFDVDDLRIGSTALGRARFRSLPMTGGLRVQEFSTAGGKQRIKATGSWFGRGQNERSALKMDVDSDDIGALLAGLGLGGQVAGGKGKLGVEATWRGGPDRFDILAMNAGLHLDARDGRLLELEPGAGRFLGLLGVAQLRRRLTLDFSDFFGKGFTFDRIKGDATLANGQLRTDDLTVHAPAADMTMRGSTDLRNQRFDQIVEVKPRSGGLLTAVGAIAGGPVGAAVGAVANAVLDKPMRGIGAKTYRVTGPWASPKVETISHATSAQVEAEQTRSDPARDAQGQVD